MRIFTNIILSLLLCLFISCKDSENEDEAPDQPYIEINENKVDFSRLTSSQTVKVTTNIEDISCKVSSAGWCGATYSKGELIITVISNEATNARTAIVSLEGENIRKTVTVAQAGRSSSTGEIKDDIKITVKSGRASSVQPGTDIDKSFDGNLSTIYHSNWSTSSADLPISLTYNFENVETMDYLVYNPRSDGGTNGNFKEFDLYIATSDNPVLTQYGSYNFQGNGSPAIITFSPALKKPTIIEFRVKSGVGSFVSCAEMQFFRRNPENFDYSVLFTDVTCSRLKNGITLSEIEQVQNKFYKELALEIYKGEYNTEFRVQEYKAWQHPDVMAAINKTGTYSLRDNPTGIYVRQGDELIALAGELYNQNISLFVQNPSKQIQGSAYPLKTGLNKFKADNDGLIYVLYHTPEGTEPAVKINITTGYVNGYFNSKKHKKEDWVNLLNQATFEHFDLVGEYAHLTFQTEKFRQYTPDGLALINKYDDLVRMEQDFMGLFKYSKAFKNRMYFVVMSGSSWMHASSYYTGYDIATQAELLTLSSFTSNPWGPAHEVGHVNQTRPGLKWKGMAEITNNIHSLYIQTLWGNRSRLVTDNVYAKAFTEIINAKIAHNEHTDPFCKVVPFWQLKLYMHDVLGKEDFYKDVYEKVRQNPNPSSEGLCQIAFVKIACDVAKLNLIDFFEAWGFLTPIDIEIDDYGKSQFIVTQSMIDECKAYIAGKGYSKPNHKIQEITDENTANFR
ncbi:carbohydrate-binding protein [Bacteroidia bacterium]|nr:carbohydrate-binding protein [Bacteroidia bacterium]